MNLNKLKERTLKDELDLIENASTIEEAKKKLKILKRFVMEKKLRFMSKDNERQTRLIFWDFPTINGLD